MAADFTIKSGDTLPVLTDTLTYSDGTSPNLAGATVQFVMRSQTVGAPLISAAATITSTTSPATVSFTFTAAQTALAGQYLGCWIVTFPTTSVMTWPTDGYLDIWVEANLTSDTTSTLISLPDAKDHLNISASDRRFDQKLLRWIMAARPVIEAITGPIVPANYDEWYDFGGMAIQLRHRPLITLQAVSIYLGPVEYPMSIVTQPQAGSIFSVMADGNRRIVRKGPGGSQIPFPSGYQSVHVLYTAGITPTPENVRMGTLEMIREHWVVSEQSGFHGRQTFGQDEQQPQHEPVDFLVSPAVREWLTPNRRHPSVY